MIKRLHIYINLFFLFLTSVCQVSCISSKKASSEFEKNSVFGTIEPTREEYRFLFSQFIKNIEVKKGLLNDDKFENLFTVEEMNRLIISGVPMRDAYIRIGEMVAENKFTTTKELNHTHAGSIGNLMNEAIRKNMKDLLAKFEFEKAGDALKELLK